MSEVGCVYTGEFCFNAGDPIYRGHFPGRPVVPGSLIVQAFLKAAETRHTSGRQWIIQDFRFKAFVVPGCYAYRIEVIEDRVLCCSLLRDGFTLAAGRLEC
jgi:3-hydroxyacyl-[acyl-carrier-protein] dehydratase